MNSLTNKDKGIIKQNSLMDLLNEKVALRKELILLKKLHESKERQIELQKKLLEIDKFLSTHKIQK